MEKLISHVHELLGGVNLYFYYDTNELQFLKDEYVDESDYNRSGGIDDIYLMIDWLKLKGVNFDELLDEAVHQEIVDRLSYVESCVELLQVDLMKCFHILNLISIEEPDTFDEFDEKKFSREIAKHIYKTYLRNDLGYEFLNNALYQLK